MVFFSGRAPEEQLFQIRKVAALSGNRGRVVKAMD